VDEGTRLEAELADRLRETEALLAISSTVTSTLDVREALRRVCRELALLSGADTAAVYLHDPASDLLRPYAAYHIPKEHLATLASVALPLREQGFRHALWSDRRPVFSGHVAEDPRFNHEIFRRVPHQSGLLLPLTLDGEVTGAFYLVWWTARPEISEHDLVRLELVGAQVAVFLRNARLYERGERVRQRLQVLNDASRRLSEVHDPEGTLSLIVHEASRLVGVEAAGIHLVAGGELVLSARTDSAEFIDPRPRLALDESFAGRVVAGGEVVAVEDLSQDPGAESARGRALLAAGFKGLLAVPLRAHGRTIGALTVYTRSRRRFLVEEIALVSAFADQASLAIEKGRFLREAEEGRRREQAARADAETAARALRASEEQYRALAEGSIQGMYIHQDSLIRFANISMARIHGYEQPHDLIGQHYLTLFPAHERVRIEGYRAARLRGEFAPTRYEAQGVRRDGTSIWVEILVSVLPWEGRPAILGTFLDITERRRAEEALRRSEEQNARLLAEEREVNRMKSDFVSFVTHQLRTPLAGIKWMLELAMEGAEIPDDTASYVRDAREATERLVSLVNDLLDISRLESGRLKLAMRETSLGDLTASVVEELGPLARGKGHRLRIDGAGSRLGVVADPQLLRQAILNLVANAIKYTRPGGDIAVRIAGADGMVCWSIQDSGIGIPKEAQRRLF